MSSSRVAKGLIRDMSARDLAAWLSSKGVPVVGKVLEPGEDADGMVELTECVHVQVPLCGCDGPNVVRELPSGEFEFDLPQNDAAKLLEDVMTALAAAGTPVVAPSSQARKPARGRSAGPGL